MGFHDWFCVHHAPKIKSNPLQSVRAACGISGRFYTNGLELTHRLQKKITKDTTGNVKAVDVVEANKLLRDFVDQYYSEAVRALRGIGKYRLANGYEHFIVQPITWDRWSLQRQQQHINTFLQFVPSQTQLFVKPKNAGLKSTPPAKHRRARLPEVELFSSRFDELQEKQQVSPIVLSRKEIKKKGNENDDRWEVASKHARIEEDPLNPDRHLTNKYVLVHREIKKDCPKAVKRCHSCKRTFSDADVVLAKTEGNREYTDKNGKKVAYSGNVYIHWLTSCLKEYDKKLIDVPARTLALLPSSAEKSLRDKGCNIVH